MFISVTGVIGFDCNFITWHYKNGILKNYNYKNDSFIHIKIILHIYLYNFQSTLSHFQVFVPWFIVHEMLLITIFVLFFLSSLFAATNDENDFSCSSIHIKNISNCHWNCCYHLRIYILLCITIFPSTYTHTHTHTHTHAHTYTHRHMQSHTNTHTHNTHTFIHTDT